MTAILGVALPVTATWEDVMKMAAKVLYLSESKLKIACNYH